MPPNKSRRLPGGKVRRPGGPGGRAARPGRDERDPALDPQDLGPDTQDNAAPVEETFDGPIVERVVERTPRRGAAAPAPAGRPAAAPAAPVQAAATLAADTPMTRRRARLAGQRAVRTGPSQMDVVAQSYAHLRGDLLRIALLALVMFGVIIALSFVIR